MERKEAIEVIKKNWPDSSFTMLREALETLIPELKESEDEKILKHLKAVIKAYDMWAERGLDMNDVLAWVEKKGEHATVLSEEQMKVLNEVLNFAANHESPYWNDYIFGTLNNLIRQLNKLREE